MYSVFVSVSVSMANKLVAVVCAFSWLNGLANKQTNISNSDTFDNKCDAFYGALCAQCILFLYHTLYNVYEQWAFSEYYST